MTDTSREAQQTSERLLIERKGMVNAVLFCLHLIPTLRLPGTFHPILHQDLSLTTLSGCHAPDKTQSRPTPPRPLRCPQKRTRPQTPGPGPVQSPPTPTHSVGQDTAPGAPRLVTLDRCTPPDKPLKTRTFLLLTSVGEYKQGALCCECT